MRQNLSGTHIATRRPVDVCVLGTPRKLAEMGLQIYSMSHGGTPPKTNEDVQYCLGLVPESLMGFIERG